MSKKCGKKCVIVLNGPSVCNINNFLKEREDESFDIIAVNRWVEIFNRFGLRMPNYVIVGKNSLGYNRNLIRQLTSTTFYGIDKYPAKNYHQLKQYY